MDDGYLDLVDTSAANQETQTIDKVNSESSDKGSELNQAKNEILGQQGNDGGNASPDNSVANKEQEVKSEALPQIVKIGDRELSIQEVEDAIQKKGKYQGDRDRAEAVLSKLVIQLQAQGYTVDNNLNIMKAPEVPNKQELIERASAGDQNALLSLLEIQKSEIQADILNGVSRKQEEQNIFDSIKKEHPEIFNDDGSLNTNAPLCKEAEFVMNRFPRLNSVDALPVIIEMAEGRLLKRNLPKYEQDIKNQTQQNLGKITGQMVGTPTNGTVTNSPDPISAEQARIAKKLGLTNDRIQNILERSKKEGAMYL